MLVAKSGCWVPWKSRKCSYNTEPSFQALKSEFSRLSGLLQSKSPGFCSREEFQFFWHASGEKRRRKDMGVPKILLQVPFQSSQWRVLCSLYQGSHYWDVVFCGWQLHGGKNGDKVKSTMCGKSGHSPWWQRGSSWCIVQGRDSTRDASCCHVGTHTSHAQSARPHHSNGNPLEARECNGQTIRNTCAIFVLFCSFVLWYWGLNLGPCAC